VKEPRPYQNEAVCSLDTGWSEGWLRQVLLLPTGTGKTFVGGLIIGAHDFSLGVVVFVAHRAELINQTVAMIHDLMPELRVGVVKAERHEVTDVDVIVASVQTLGLSPLKRASIGKVGLLIIDECHHAAARTYKDVVTDFGGFENTRVVGLTATLVRNDKLGLGDVWQRVAFERSIKWAEDNNFLVRHDEDVIVIPSLRLEDVPQVKVNQNEDDSTEDGKDYSARGLGKQLVDLNAGPILASKYKAKAGDKQGIVFAPTVAAAVHILDAFNAAGIRSALITGETEPEDRELIFKMIRNHELQVIVNVMVLTEGFDLPQLEVAVIARITKSKSLKVQMVGRVKRLSEETGKTRALVLYVSGETAAVSTKNLVDLKRTGSAGAPLEKAKAKARQPKARIPVASYKATIAGKTVIVVRTIGTEHLEVARFTLKKTASAADLRKAATLLIKRDQIQRGKR
jgi:superfamily II DNA or RNA helicase